MVTYLTKFETYEEYEEVVDTKLTRPHVSYISEEDRVIYNSANGTGDNQILAGDFVCVKDGLVTCIPYSKYNASEGYTPIAIVVVPPTHTNDGSTRAMSLVNMYYENPETGTTTLEPGICFGGYQNDLSLTNMTRAVAWDNNIESPNYNAQISVYLPSDISSGTSCVVDTTAYYTSSTPYGVSPYANNGVSEYYQQEKIGSFYNALSDMDGAGNTAVIMGQQTANWTVGSISNTYETGNFPMACCCKRFKTEGTLSGTWYLPSCGEMGYVWARLKEIENSLSIAGATKLKSSMYYLTSTEYSSANMRSVNLNTGRVYYSNRRDNLRCRAFHKFFF